MPKLIEIIHHYNYHSNDVAVALYRVVEKTYGVDRLLGLPHRWFPWRQTPILFEDVKIGVNEQTRGLSGAFRIDGINGWFTREGSAICICIEEGLQNEATTLLENLSKQLDSASIYRGKAITVNGEFLDLSQIEEKSVVYSAGVFEDLRAHVWSFIEKPDICQRMGVGLPQKVLFFGQFGSGKTTAVFLTAQKAIRNGWTFLCVEPAIAEHASKTISQILEIAINYQPAVISIEDIDREQRQHDPFALGNFMASLDGPVSKNSNLLFLMTTNFIGKIAAGIHRPGRIDRIIDFNRFDGTDAWRLLCRVIPEKYLEADINQQKIVEACQGYQAAFVRGVATAAKLKAISEAPEGQTPIITEKMLIAAASDLRFQHKLCTEEQVGFKN